MHPMAYLDLISFSASVIAAAFLVRGCRRASFAPAVPILLAVLLALMACYHAALFLEWSGLAAGLDWVEDIAGLFIPFTWAFVLYAFVKNAVEDELRANQQRLRSLASELSLAEERERRRIAAGLHDYACQNLVLSKMKLQGLPMTETDEIEGVCDTIDSTIESVRGLIFDLSSPTLYKFGLEAAVEELLEERVKAQHNIECTFRDDGAAKPLAEDVRIVLFQSVRELLFNIIKHAQARAVTVAIGRLNDSVRITVTDDGIGFDVEEALAGRSRRHGFGLFYIQARLDFIGGRLDMESQPGHGSRFALLAPLETETIVTEEPHDGQQPSAD